jgi:outer membrane protein TolC
MAALALALLAALLAGAPVAAQGEDAGSARDPELAALLAGVEEHPALRAAQRSVDAARAELSAVRFPVALEGEVGAQRPSTSVDAAPGVPQEAIDAAGETEWSTSASIRAQLRPLPLGDIATLEAQRRLALEQAERRLRRTRASLEAGAVQAAAGLVAAEQGVRIAEAGLALAREAAAATELRAERGAARTRDVERAELEVARAEERLRAATASRTQAADRLADLVGPSRRLTRLPSLPPADVADAGVEDPDVQDAAADVDGARIGVGAATRDLLPTARASYAWNTGDGALSLSLETRTFQPTVGYDTPGPFENGAPADELPPGLDVEVESSISLGLSFRLGAEGFAAADAARSRLAAAEAGLASARLDAARAADERAEALRAARAELDFVRADLDLARADAADVRRRAELGLATPLEAHRADLSALQADLAVTTARIELLSAHLRGYRELAVPLSEVLP